MIVKIFPPKAGFKAVRYNTNKMADGRGELMKAYGFRLFEGFSEIRPEDYRHYLEAQSGLNSRVRLPQFHAVISAPDRHFDKYKLTRLAEQWLAAMGYGEQPYLLVFHHDTDQAHMHLVSTRVTREGKKVNDRFEFKRAVQELNRLMALDERHQAQLTAGKALSYRYSTRKQFLLLLERMGYRLQQKDGHVVFYKFGRPLYSVGEEKIRNAMVAGQIDSQRAAQLKAIIKKYRPSFDCALQPEMMMLAGGRMKETGGYRSELTDFLKEKFGLELVFHSSAGQPPYGYTMIDHAEKQVFKGSEVLRLKELTGPAAAVSGKKNSSHADTTPSAPEHSPRLRFHFTNDIDDQQIHGPRRRRQKKARTNTR